MIQVDEARRKILELAGPLEVVEVGLDEALGRVLAEDLAADRDFPPTDRSAMDGFAVRWEDVHQPGATLRLAGELRAGRPVGATRVDPGTCVRIMTGAIVPPGADTVVMVELTREDRDSGTVTLFGEARRGQHIRARGEDAAAGAPILRSGAPIHAAEIAALASVGHTRVRVRRAPRVAVLSTGDEVVEPERVPEPFQVRNSNGRALIAQLHELGLPAHDLGIVPDDRRRLHRAIEAGLQTDLLLVTGGVSVGEYDLVGEVLQAAGMAVVFHEVAIRPGKPILVGQHERCLVVGLPGNPVSTFTDFAVFVAPALRRMLGHERWDHPRVRARLAAPLKRKPDRTTYHLARVRWSGGSFEAWPIRTMGSGDVLSMVQANAFVITPGSPHALQAGESVEAELWRDFQLRADEPGR